MIYIVGIGPGNSKDYLTLKAYSCLMSADVGIYIGEMIGEDIRNVFKGKVMYFSNNISISKVKSIIKNSYKNSKTVAIMVPGDVSLFSGHFLQQLSFGEYIDWFEKEKLNYKIIPGVSSWSALNAKLGLDMTDYNSASNNIYITSVGWKTKSEKFDLANFEIMVSTKPRLVLFQSYEKWQTIKHILEKFYSPSTRTIFAYKITWREERIIDTTLSESCQFIGDKNLEKHTLILILPDKKNEEAPL